MFLALKMPRTQIQPQIVIVIEIWACVAVQNKILPRLF